MTRQTLAKRSSYDYVLVGAGLQNSLIGLALLAENPAQRIALIERSWAVGGNHTWCFHAGDVPGSAMAFVEPLVAHRWPGYDVAFPGLERRVDASYSAVTSDQLRKVVAERFATHHGSRIVLGHEAVAVEPDHVRLANGQVIEAPVVVDARGPGAFAPTGAVAYQKFLGLELELSEPCTRQLPLLMDARVPQTDGFRFVYVLPLGERRVLVEDTYYSDTPDIDAVRLRHEVLSYALRQGMKIDSIVREESGVLPLPSRPSPMPAAESPLAAGFQGGWFHPTTGYSFPLAVRLALHVAQSPIEELFGSRYGELLRQHRKQARFAHFLNRLLFGAFAPEDRRNVLERFYELPEPTIRRFYAMATTSGDRARILCGRPPRGLSLRTALSRGTAT